MSNQIYKFSAHKGKHHFMGEFAASKAEIKWIIGKKLWFWSFDPKEPPVRMTVKASHFSLTVSENHPEKVQEWMEKITLVGICPFNRLNDEQYSEYLKHFSGH